MDMIAALDQQLADIASRGLKRQLRVVESPCAPRMVVDGKPMLAFCSNDYLGLAAHPRVVAALKEGAELYGAGSGASHLISGHSAAHDKLERQLAAVSGMQRALYFGSGYMANLAVLTALGGEGAEIFSEQLNHASLIDGARLARASVSVYLHNNPEALGAMLAASKASTKIVVTDNVFSMDGNLAALPELLALCQRHDAWLVVDDAHGFGVLGSEGGGAFQHFGMDAPNLVYMGTLGKAAGVGGAFVAAHASVIETLVQRARPYIYTTAAAPALAHALSASLDIISGEEGKALRASLAVLIDQCRDELRLERWKLMPSQTAIQPVMVGENTEALRLSAALYEQGLWVAAIRPPTVPAGTARLRITLSAAHTAADVTQLATALNALERASQ
jgi:8-amino-7-oxononanoate synthase